MEFISRFTDRPEVDSAVCDLTSGLSGSFDYGILFIAGFGSQLIADISKKLQDRLSIKSLVGCSGYGVIGAQREVEGLYAISLLLGRLGTSDRVTAFHLEQDQFGELKTPEEWYELLDVYPNEKPSFLILADPQEIDISQFLDGMNAAYPGCAIIGGLASNTRLDATNTLILNERCLSSGIVVAALTGTLKMDTLVSQGCRPIGESYIVTKSEENVIYELAGRPFYEVLEEVLTQARAKERKLAQEAIYIGIAIDEYKYRMAYGDFLIRLLIGVDENSGAGIITDFVHQGQTIQFQVRDPVRAEEDLTAVLEQRQHEPSLPAPVGALLFSCSARGEEMFGRRDHDLNIFKKFFTKVPLAGCFTAGEIGPVKHKNYVHGLSTSVALFYPASEKNSAS